MRFLFLFLAIVTGFAEDTGVNPVPPNVQLLAPGPIGSTTPNTGSFTTLTVSTNEYVGCTSALSGTTSFDVSKDAANCLASVSAHGSNKNGQLLLASSGGTFASPTATQSGDTIGTLSFAGYTGSGYAGRGLIIAIATETWGSTRGTQLVFQTTPTGSGSNATALTIDQDKALISLGNIRNTVGLGWGVTSTVTAGTTTTIATTSTAVQVFTGSTTQTVTLPAANAFGAGVGYVLLIKNVSSGVVTVNRAGSDTINDASSVTTKAVASFAALRLVSDGVSAWEVL